MIEIQHTRNKIMKDNKSINKYKSNEDQRR